MMTRHLWPVPPSPICLKHSDGGRCWSRVRALTGTPKGDCFVRTMANAENMSYDKAWVEIAEFCQTSPRIIAEDEFGRRRNVAASRNPSNGVDTFTCGEFLTMYGWEPHEPAIKAPIDSFRDIINEECKRTNRLCVVEVPFHIFCMGEDCIVDEFDVRKFGPDRSLLLRAWTKEREGSYDANYAASRLAMPPRIVKV